MRRRRKHFSTSSSTSKQKRTPQRYVFCGTVSGSVPDKNLFLQGRSLNGPKPRFKIDVQNVFHTFYGTAPGECPQPDLYFCRVAVWWPKTYHCERAFAACVPLLLFSLGDTQRIFFLKKKNGWACAVRSAYVTWDVTGCVKRSNNTHTTRRHSAQCLQTLRRSFRSTRLHELRGQTTRSDYLWSLGAHPARGTDLGRLRAQRTTHHDAASCGSWRRFRALHVANPPGVAKIRSKFFLIQRGNQRQLCWANDMVV